MTYVLDASAMLAILLEEKGAERVAAVLDDAIVSSVNLSEIVAKLSELGVSDDDIRDTTETFVQMTQEFSSHHAIEAGLLRKGTKDRGLSLGDRACIALALSEESASVMTADRVWANLDIGVEIEVIR